MILLIRSLKCVRKYVDNLVVKKTIHAKNMNGVERKLGLQKRESITYLQNENHEDKPSALVGLAGKGYPLAY